MHSSKRIEIRWRDLDGFAHVNNSTYLTYLEEARDEFFTELLGDTVHRVVVRRIEIDFRSPLVQDDDHAVVELELVAVGRSSATTRERIVSAADGRVAAEAETVVVHIDADRTAAEPWDAAARAALEARRG
jgi:acyl-CoA thioester hydrolase